MKFEYWKVEVPGFSLQRISQNSLFLASLSGSYFRAMYPYLQESSEDEKIWRQIDLIRAIVGFKTPRHPSYFEELKELYAFTGIEWPSLVKDPSELTEFNNKLHFLMSVIGVK